MSNNLTKYLIIFFLSITFTLSSQNFKPLTLSEVKASGWIRAQIARDWTSGSFSRMYINMPVNMGHIKVGSNVTAKFRDLNNRWVYQWDWNEMDGNLADGAIRAGFLADNAAIKSRFKLVMDFMVDSVAATQYVDSLAYSAIGGGELFNQTCMQRAMLAYYEYTSDVRYLNAVITLVDKTINHWNRQFAAGKSYFGRPFDKKGAMYHSLTYGDILEYLYRKNPDRKYVDFAFRLYNDFTQHLDLVGNADDGGADATLDILADPSVMFLGHGPHTAEQLRMPLWLIGFANDSVESIKAKYQKAITNIPIKFNKSLSPSKGLVTDLLKAESVNGKYSSGNSPYEYCSLTETLMTMSSMCRKFADIQSAETSEVLFFNAAQGSRFADGKANTYLICDNVAKATKVRNWRDQFSALHGIRCCNLNAGRIAPNYVANMWMKNQSETELIAMLHGPSIVNTKLNGVNVRIEVITNYPFENTLRYLVKADAPVNFTLVLRNPIWSDNSEITAEGASVTSQDGFYRIQKTWGTSQQTVTLKVNEKIELKKLDNPDSKDFYVQRGALIYTYPYTNTKTFEQVTLFPSGFYSWDVEIPSILSADYAAMSMHNDSKNMLARDSSYLRYHESTPFISDYPFDFPRGKVTSRFVVSGSLFERDLIPLGCTTTRRTTFPTSNQLGTVTSMTIELQGNRKVRLGSSTQFTAIVKNQFNIAISNPSLIWSVSSGIITQQGLYTATNTNGNVTISVKCGVITSNFVVNVTNETSTNEIYTSRLFAYPTVTEGDVFFSQPVNNVTLYTLQGRKVLVKESLPNKMNIAHLPNGYYFLNADGIKIKIIKI